MLARTSYTHQRGIFETLLALIQRRPRRALYHSTLIAITDAPFVIEMTPIPDSHGREDRGVVAEGIVGTRWARHLRVFRYEIRRWHHGVIPDIAYAVASPVHIADDDAARTLLDLGPLVPTPVWGRDELDAGEMWNSNSVTAWLLVSAGLDASASHPRSGGRAPGGTQGRPSRHAKRLLDRTPQRCEQPHASTTWVSFGCRTRRSSLAGPRISALTSSPVLPRR